MHYKFSTAMASFCNRIDPAQTMKQIRDAGYDSVDFPFSVYSFGSQAPMLSDNWRDWARRVGRLSHELNLPVTQAHAPWIQDIPSDFHYTAPLEIYERTMEAASLLGCKQVIFHPVRLRERIDSLRLRERIHDWNVRWFHDLLPASERFNIYINIENTFDSHHVQQGGDPPYPYTTGEDMLRLLHDVGSSRIRLCLDTGHANISGQNIPEMIRSFRGELSTLHLNDNYGHIAPIHEDLHLFPGNGRIHWTPIFQALKEIRYSGVMNIEPIGELPKLDENSRLIQLQNGLQCLKSIIRDSLSSSF